MDYQVHPIGIIHSPFTDKSLTPIQASRSDATGFVEIYPDFAEGLQDLEGFSHIILLYFFHESTDFSLIVKPFLDNQLHGVFATRYPARPNQIGLSIVKLTSQIGSILQVEGVDMLDGTPLLDIKPYVAEFDLRLGTRHGWYDTRSK
jgi:tRNA (adenine37-N6)-methyltransferase